MAKIYYQKDILEDPSLSSVSHENIFLLNRDTNMYNAIALSVLNVNDKLPSGTLEMQPARKG